MELVCLFLVVIGLMKFLTTVKMLIMMMSLEMSSVFLFSLLVLLSMVGEGVEIGLYSVFLVFMVCEGVLVLVSMVNIFRKGSIMVKSLYVLKF